MENPATGRVYNTPGAIQLSVTDWIYFMAEWEGLVYSLALFLSRFPLMKKLSDFWKECQIDSALYGFQPTWSLSENIMKFLFSIEISILASKEIRIPWGIVTYLVVIINVFAYVESLACGCSVYTDIALSGLTNPANPSRASIQLGYRRSYWVSATIGQTGASSYTYWADRG